MIQSPPTVTNTIFHKNAGNLRHARIHWIPGPILRNRKRAVRTRKRAYWRTLDLCIDVRLRARPALSWSKKHSSSKKMMESLRDVQRLCRNCSKAWPNVSRIATRSLESLCPLSKYWCEVKLKRNLRLEKMVASKLVYIRPWRLKQVFWTRLKAYTDKWSQLPLIIQTGCSGLHRQRTGPSSEM